jgi:hypothetical protein
MMFAAFMHEDGIRLPVEKIALMFAVCFAGDFLFWSVMSAFMQLATRYSDTYRIVPKQRTYNGSIFISTLFR